MAEVESVLGGQWSLDDSRPDHLCLYTSDRGAAFGATLIDAPADEIDDELLVAWQACNETSTPDPPAETFVCLEDTADGLTLISGSIVAKGRLWLLSMVALESKELQADQYLAMDALIKLALESG